MRHMVGPDWRQLFDVVIVQADKPSFFTDPRKYGPGRGGGAREWGCSHVSECPEYCPVCLGCGCPLVGMWEVGLCRVGWYLVHGLATD